MKFDHYPVHRFVADHPLVPDIPGRREVVGLTSTNHTTVEHQSNANRKYSGPTVVE